MHRYRRLELSAEQYHELEDVRDHDERPYMREKAAALLKVAQGEVASQVARWGLFKPRDTDTVYRWLKAYEAGGVHGLAVQAGRGRKAAFSPSVRQRRAGP